MIQTQVKDKYRLMVILNFLAIIIVLIYDFAGFYRIRWMKEPPFGWIHINILSDPLSFVLISFIVLGFMVCCITSYRGVTDRIDDQQFRDLTKVVPVLFVYVAVCGLLILIIGLFSENWRFGFGFYTSFVVSAIDWIIVDQIADLRQNSNLEV